jgi:hypothetical protein
MITGIRQRLDIIAVHGPVWSASATLIISTCRRHPA